MKNLAVNITAANVNRGARDSVSGLVAGDDGKEPHGTISYSVLIDFAEYKH